MGTGAGCTTIGVDRKDMGGAPKGAYSDPAAVLAETHVLNLNQKKGRKDKRKSVRQKKVKIKHTKQVWSMAIIGLFVQNLEPFTC